MLGRVDRAGNSNEFAACMLRIIRNALKEISERQGQNVVINVVTIEETILVLLKHDGKHTAKNFPWHWVLKNGRTKDCWLN